MAIEHKVTVEENVVRLMAGGGSLLKGITYLASLLDGLLRLNDLTAAELDKAVVLNREDAVTEKETNAKEQEFQRIASEQAARIIEAAREAALHSKKAENDLEREQIRKDAIAAGIEIAKKQLATLFVK